MDSERFGRGLSLTANFGLLVGLILVAVEVQQNSELVRMQLINDGNIALNQVWSVLMGENPTASIAKSIETPEEMTYAEYMVVDAYLFTSLSLYYRNFELAREGVFDEADWQ